MTTNNRRFNYGRGAVGVLSITASLCVVLIAVPSLAEPILPEDRVAWLREHATPIRTINPDDDDFADLAQIEEAIGAVRVVMLGEASHGDGATFLAKTRLIKFLHQRMGFDVLVWESGFFDCAKAGEAMVNGAPWRDSFDDALLSLWSGSEQCRSIMEYVHSTQTTDRPIALTGMSWYVSAESSLFDDVIALLESVDPESPTSEQREALTAIKKLLEDSDERPFPKRARRPPELLHVQALIDLIATDKDGKLLDKHGQRRLAFMRIALENLKGYLLFLNRPLSRGGTGDNPIGVLESRSFLLLAREHFPNRKLIVWAHNGHLARNTSRVEELGRKFRFNKMITTGHRVHKALGDAVYSVMFVAYGGRTGIWWQDPHEVSTPSNGSVEDLLHRTGFAQAFVNLRELPSSHWLRGRLVASPIARSPMRADWADVFDGLFFLDAMAPSTPIEKTD